MNTLKLNGQEIHSLEELRQNCDITQLTAAFLNGTLETWLSACYYEREADAVLHLEHTLTPAVERKLCTILGLVQAENAYMTPEQQAAYEKKCAVIRRCSADNSLLAHAMETATNQAELAELLDSGCQQIYLCEGSFSVPIRKSGIHYVGIGEPKMAAPFTEEQYRRAGITFENISLPTETDKDAEHVAKQAAQEHGYDNFAERHCRLAAIIHDGIKGFRLSQPYHLNVNTDISGEFYKSKHAAEHAARNVIDSAYTEANVRFLPDYGNCIANDLSTQYAAIIRKGAGAISERLQSLPEEKKKLAYALDRLICTAEQELQKRFEQELTDSADYYQMYDKSYFMERIEIEKNDYNVDLFDNDLLNGLARLVHDDSDYTIENLFETVMELEEDLNKHADTFFGCAYQEYRNYCGEIEKIAEEIGKDLSDDDLYKLGILQEAKPA